MVERRNRVMEKFINVYVGVRKEDIKASEDQA